MGSTRRLARRSGCKEQAMHVSLFSPRLRVFKLGPEGFRAKHQITVFAANLISTDMSAGFLVDHHKVYLFLVTAIDSKNTARWFLLYPAWSRHPFPGNSLVKYDTEC